MDTPQLLMMAVGLATAAALVWAALAGPSPTKESTRRLSSIRFRHSENTRDRVEAQMRRAVAARKPKLHAIAGSNSRVEALALRLHRTGKGWTVTQYLYASLGLGAAVTAIIRNWSRPLAANIPRPPWSVCSMRLQQSSWPPAAIRRAPIRSPFSIRRSSMRSRCRMVGFM